MKGLFICGGSAMKTIFNENGNIGNWSSRRCEVVRDLLITHSQTPVNKTGQRSNNYY